MATLVVLTSFYSSKPCEIVEGQLYLGSMQASMNVTALTAHKGKTYSTSPTMNNNYDQSRTSSTACLTCTKCGLNSNNIPRSFRISISISPTRRKRTSRACLTRVISSSRMHCRTTVASSFTARKASWQESPFDT